MKIGFWSTIHGQPGTTSNLLATSVLGCILNQKKVAVLQTQFSLNNLTFPLIGSNLNAQLMDTGIDALLRDYKSGPITEKTVFADSLSILKNQYSLFTETGKANRENFESELQQAFPSVIKKIDEHHDLTFVDVGTGRSEGIKKILNEMDIVVVNFYQNRKLIEDYIRNPLEHDNIIFLFGKYDYDSKYNIKNLRRTHLELRNENCCAVNYNCGFLDAFNDGDIINFFMKNQAVGKDSANYEFIHSVKNVLATIEKRGEALGKDY